MAERIQKELQARKEKIDWDAVARLSHEPRGIPVSVTGGPDQLDAIVASATIVQNKVAPGATWDGMSRPARRRGDLPGDGVRPRAVGRVRRRRPPRRRHGGPPRNESEDRHLIPDAVAPR